MPTTQVEEIEDSKDNDEDDVEPALHQVTTKSPTPARLMR